MGLRWIHPKPRSPIYIPETMVTCASLSKTDPDKPRKNLLRTILSPSGGIWSERFPQRKCTTMQFFSTGDKPRKYYIRLLWIIASGVTSRMYPKLPETQMRSIAFILRSKGVHFTFRSVQGLCKFYVKYFSNVPELFDPFSEGFAALCPLRT